MESNTISIPVNGSPITRFAPHRGLRQGDLLVPFLFLIVAEELSGLMRHVVEKQLFKSFLVVEAKVEVNLLQFSNDTLS